ncbi:MAG: helix-turn-helix domain-containing protein [Ruminococcus sp.]|nr:helix-turn-helix domain-containing protein [Ruminococcus sp.]
MYNPQITVDRIKELRTIKGISLAELNEACGLNKNTITVSANSKTGLSAKILSDVSKFLGCSVDYLLGETDNISHDNSRTATVNDDIQSNNNAIVEIETIISKLTGASRYRAIADVLEVLEKYA